MAIEAEMTSIPAYEAVKYYVVTKLQDLTSLYSDIQRFRHMKKYPRALVAVFKSEVMAFYIFLRPKILLQSMRQGFTDYKQIMNYADGFLMKPRTLTLGRAILVYIILNQFCEDFRLTSTTFYSGRSVGGDTY